jgi:hypothetical protein
MAVNLDLRRQVVDGIRRGRERLVRVDDVVDLRDDVDGANGIRQLLGLDSHDERPIRRRLGRARTGDKQDRQTKGCQRSGEVTEDWFTEDHRSVPLA